MVFCKQLNFIYSWLILYLSFRSSTTSACCTMMCTPYITELLSFRVQVTFHLLIPNHLWNWNVNEGCRLSVRHGCDETKKDWEDVFPSMFSQ